MDENPDPVMWAQLVADAKAGANWWPTAPTVGRATPFEGELVYPITVTDQLAAEITHRLALLAPLVDAEDQQAMVMRLRQMDAEAALRLCVALFPWGWPDQCGAGEWWLTALGRQAAKALAHRPEIEGPMSELGACASTREHTADTNLWRLRHQHSNGRKPSHRKPEHWPYMRAKVLGCLVTMRYTTVERSREVRVTHRWLRRRLGLRAG